MEPRISTYLHQKAMRLGIPINGSFELTPRCNFNCAMCYVHLSAEEQRRRGRELTGDEWISIAEQAKRAGTVFLLLTGGEPLLHPDFIPIYRQLKKMGFLLSINTNGSLIEGEYLDLFREDPPFRLNITLYSTSDDGYQAQCGVPAFTRVRQNIAALRAAGVTLRINLTITPTNQAEMAALLDTAKALDAVIVGGTYLFPPVRVRADMTGTNQRPAPEEAALQQVCYERLKLSPSDFLARAGRVAHGEAPLAHADDECELGGKMQCRAGRAVYWIDWQGNMTPCGQMPIPAANVPALGFDAAWQSIRAQTAQIRLPSECVGCPHEKLCHACAAKCYTETGSFCEKPDYVCRYTNAYFDEMKRAWEEGKEHGA